MPITATDDSQSGRAGGLWLPPLAANDRVGTPTQASKRREGLHQQQERQVRRLRPPLLAARRQGGRLELSPVASSTVSSGGETVGR